MVKALDNVTLNVADHEFVVIVGPSGCGKTTTLRLIAGLEEPTAGRITIGQTVVNDLSPRERDIAIVFQNYALFPYMTVFQNMAFGLKLRKYPTAEVEMRVQEAAKLLGIAHLLEKKPAALSGGQRQRVAVGRAIVRDPKAFLFDEPLSNLDAALRLTTRAELKSLHQRLWTTTIYVTHDQAEAMTLGDRICVMRDGIIRQTGPPMEVYEQPANRFVAGFLGMPPMNFLEGRIEFEHDIPRFVMKGKRIVLPARLKGALAAFKGKEMTLGIRPEHFSASPIQGQPQNRISARVDVVEPLGDRVDVCLTSSFGQRFVIKTAPDVKMKIGDQVTLYADTAQVHIFVPGEMGKNINLPGQQV